LLLLLLLLLRRRRRLTLTADGVAVVELWAGKA
jgi:hypothetical protein